MFNLSVLLRPIDLRREVRKHVTAMFSHLGPKAQVYDIGCGSKPFAKILETRGCKCVGVDLESGFYGAESIDLIGSAYSVPISDGVADAVLSIQVIEHLERPRDAFLEANRILKPGGVMIVSFPFLYPIHAAPFDYMRYTRFFLLNLAKESGFEVLEQRDISGFWYLTGMNFGLYFQVLDRGILKKVGAIKLVISIFQWLCMVMHRSESVLLSVARRHSSDFRQAWPVNYVYALKKKMKDGE